MITVVDLKWEDLTPKEQWKYVNQDYVREYELLPRSAVGDIADSTLCGLDLDNPVKLKETIIGLYEDGKKEDEIAYHVPCSLQYIYRVLENFKNEPSLKDKILELYAQGFTKKQIIFKLQCTKQWVNKILSGNSLN